MQFPQSNLYRLLQQVLQAWTTFHLLDQQHQSNVLNQAQILTRWRLPHRGAGVIHRCRANCFTVFCQSSASWLNSTINLDSNTSSAFASIRTKDVLFLVTRLVAYWPALIHTVAHANLYCRHVTSGRLAVCYSQIRSILSSATAFPTATLHWQQSRYRTINGKKLKPAILWA